MSEKAAIKKLYCKYCGEELEGVPYLEAVDGLIGHPKCYKEYLVKRFLENGDKKKIDEIMKLEAE